MANANLFQGYGSDDPYDILLRRQKQKEAEEAARNLGRPPSRQEGRERIDMALPVATAAPATNVRPPETFMPEGDLNSAYNVQPQAYDDRARLLPPDQVTGIAGAFNQPGYTDPGSYDRPNLVPFENEINQSQQRLESLSNPNSPTYRPVVDNDRGFWKRLGSILREAVIGAGNQWNANANISDPWQRLATAGGGGISGGLIGGFDRTIDERRKRQYDVGEERVRLGDYYKQQKNQGEAEQRAAATQQKLDQPQLEREKILARIGVEAQRQVNRLEVLREKEAAEGKKWTVITRNGKLYKKFADREEPLIDPTTGEHEIDLLKNPQTYKTEDGRTVYMTGAQIANAEALKTYRDAMVGLSKERLAEDKRQFAVTNTRQAAEAIAAIRKHGLELGESEEVIEAMIAKYKGDLPEAIRKQMK